MDFSLVTIYIRDMDVSIRFYHELLGMEVRTRHAIGAGGEMAILGKEGCPNLELLCIADRTDYAYAGFSIGFSVANLEETMLQLEKQGFPMLRGPISPAPHIRLAFFRDPDGVEIELIEKT